MPILLIIVFVAVVIVGFIIFKKITNRSKKCPLKIMLIRLPLDNILIK